MTSGDPDSARLERVAEVIRSLNDTARYQQLPRTVCDRMRSALRAEAVILYTVQGRDASLVFEFARGKRDQALRGQPAGFGDEPAATAARQGAAVLVEKVGAGVRGQMGAARKLGLRPRSVVAVPLVHRGDIVGVAEAVNRRGGDAFDGDDLATAELLAEPLALAVALSQLRDRVDRVELEYSLFKRVSQSMGRSLERDEVLRGILRNLKRLLPYDAAAIFVLDRDHDRIVSVLHTGYPRGADEKIGVKMDEGLVGLSASQKQGLLVADVRENPLYVAARARTRSEMVAPMISRDRVIGLFNLESDRIGLWNAADLRLLEAFAGQAAVSIERANLYEEQREKEEIQEELRLARTVQEFFTPQTAKKMGRVRIAGANFPSLEVSGDYFDYFPVRGDLFAFAIADVAGKGVPASLIMSSLRATLHTVAPYLTSARQIALRANSILRETVRPEDFVTAFIGVIDPATGAVTYCNAGHEPPLLMSPDGGCRLLETGGPILGVFEHPPMVEGRFRLGDETLLCYTDGATEALNESGEEFGPARLIEAVREHQGLTPHRMVHALFRSLREFAGETAQRDDTTFLAVKRGR